MAVNFTKMQSAGNDFVLIETSNMSSGWSQFARTICRRSFGVGADGLLLLIPSEIADIGMLVFNADGYEAEACGNGLICLVKYAVDQGLSRTGVEDVKIETISGIREARIFTEAGKVNGIQVGMGKPEFDAYKIPVAVKPGKGKLVDIKLITDYPLSIKDRELRLSFISMGNPHAIHFQKKPLSSFPLSWLGPIIERNKLFPNRVNFELANIINRKRIDVRVWERGAGETLACGSGACAVAVVAQLLDYVDSPVDINLPGGILEVAWDRAGEVLLSGTAETVFSGEWPD